jgi:beta-ribofuranosylaminobenzene 5'-phosphate synthase
MMRTAASEVSADVATVTTAARLHFGFLDPSGRGSHPFGSFGLSLDRPQTRLNLKRARALAVTGTEAERAERYLRVIASSFGISQAYALHLDEAIPPHAGLGSGTQLALAVGSAFAALEGIPLGPREIAARLGRGSRSGIGIASFAEGGAVLDGGPVNGSLPELVYRLPFPAEWRVLLIFDPGAQGLAGPDEVQAFQSLPDFPESETAELRRRVMEVALPALAERSFETFCREITNLQTHMARYFGPHQGGAYVSPLVAEGLGWLAGNGLTGLGQSSWGPTGFAFVASEQQAEALLEDARRENRFAGLRFELARGRNEGASITLEKTDIR